MKTPPFDCQGKMSRMNTEMTLNLQEHKRLKVLTHVKGCSTKSQNAVEWLGQCLRRTVLVSFREARHPIASVPARERRTRHGATGAAPFPVLAPGALPPPMPSSNSNTGGSATQQARIGPGMIIHGFHASALGRGRSCRTPRRRTPGRLPGIVRAGACHFGRCS